MTDYKVGQKVWLRATYKGPGKYGYPHSVGVDGRFTSLLNDHDVRSLADFINPLDQAIVDAAVKWFENVDPEEDQPDLCEAVQAKLDAEKPNVEKIIHDTLLGQGLALDGSKYAYAVKNALTYAGLLKEDS